MRTFKELGVGAKFIYHPGEVQTAEPLLVKTNETQAVFLCQGNTRNIAPDQRVVEIQI